MDSKFQGVRRRSLSYSDADSSALKDHRLLLRVVNNARWRFTFVWSVYAVAFSIDGWGEKLEENSGSNENLTEATRERIGKERKESKI